MLYDCRTNKLIPDKTLWSHETLLKLSSTIAQESSRFELVSEHTFSQKAFQLGLSADHDLQLSLLSGLVQAEGAARFLYDRTTSKNMSRVTLNYKSTKHSEQLTLDPLGMVEFPKVFEEDIATHVVTGVVYGADAFFVFDQEVGKDQDVKTTQENMELKIRQLLSHDGISIDGSASLIAENGSVDERKFTCRYYGDVVLPSCPTTFQEAVEVCKELPKLIKDRAVAKKVQLLPLADLDTKCQRFAHEVGSSFLKEIETLFDFLDEVEVLTKDLIHKQSDVLLSFTGIQKELTHLKRLVSDYTHTVKTNIATLLPRIRAGKVPITNLQDVIKQNSLSPFRQESLNSLILEKEKEMRYLEQFLAMLKRNKHVIFAFNDGELDAIFDTNDAHDVVCFDFNILWDNHNALNRMEAYLQDGKAIVEETTTVSESWYTGHALETIQDRIDLFAGHVKANYDRQGMKYVVTNGQSKLAKQATGELAIISLYQNQASPAQFEPIGPPGKPHCKAITSNSAELAWDVPKHGSTDITSYTVGYSYEPNNWNKVNMIQNKSYATCESIIATISGLTPNTIYHFVIKAENAYGSSPYSSVSDSVTTKPPVVLKEKYLSHCGIPIQEGIPKVFKLPSRVTFQSEIIVKRDALGGSSVTAAFPQKVVMLVGATGSGKSTLINAMANYILGVKWEDDYRFKLITEKTSDDQTKSQTKVITAYTFHNEDGFSLPYSLTVIDTPGFGDTEGLERDKKITAQIKEFFCTKNGIDQLHAVCFVVQSSLPRLTPTQSYIFNAILSIFGKDIAKNIFLMTTFADGGEPQVVDAIDKAKIPYEEYFEFNNSAVFADKSCRKAKFNMLSWDMGIESFERFFNALFILEARSLQLTQEVLTERQKLEVCLEGLQPQIQAGLSEKSELEKTKHEIKQREADMRANKDFTIKVKVTKQRKVGLPNGLFTTTCTKCNYTCHIHCTIADNDKKHECHAMTWFTWKEDTTCTICPSKCSWTVHKNTPYRYEFYECEERQTLKEIKERYKVAKSSKNELEDIIEQINQRIREVDDVIEHMLQQARYSLVRLQEIALKPNPMSQEEYIELLIEAEKQEHKLGWQDRVKGLEDAKKKASMIKKVEKGDVACFYTGPARPMGDPRGRHWLNMKAHNALEWVGKQVDKIV